MECRRNPTSLLICHKSPLPSLMCSPSGSLHDGGHRLTNHNCTFRSGASPLAGGLAGLAALYIDLQDALARWPVSAQDPSNGKAPAVPLTPPGHEAANRPDSATRVHRDKTHSEVNNPSN
ncbi:hypothetical protein VPNG_04852 [Cytospora leucostoma]|uniref:Uncharacterized protein n=1 Tax=Cytospora leucostoma TaxID=1230097 RepID=A0A423XB37_9PEZI|nr:hypothetical protein VPNG_04852 [Cytospora leucostoma]